jgi:endonuclease-8
MEGPSIVIAKEEFKPFLGRAPSRASGTAKLPSLRGKKLLKTRSWGKHFLLQFEGINLRVHFLMFGSYRINNPRENRIPKLELKFGKDTIYFYSCAIKPLEGKLSDLYDWSVDVMSPKWDEEHALEQLRKKPDTLVCDALMDQTIFAGVGNIIKNEVLWNLHLHPETPLGILGTRGLRYVVKEAQAYCWKFYEWKKQNVLKRNWKVMRKKTCPRCELPVIRKNTGKLDRVSWYCEGCQHVGEAKEKERAA